LLGASASLSIVWLSQKWKRSSTASFGVKVERKQSAHAKQSALAIGEDVLDHEQLSNRMLRKAEAVIQWRTSRLIIVIERCTNGTLTIVKDDWQILSEICRYTYSFKFCFFISRPQL
jgi:hypothetical protein